MYQYEIKAGGKTYVSCYTEFPFDDTCYTGSSNLYMLVDGYDSDVPRPYIVAGTDALRTGSYNSDYYPITSVELIHGGLQMPVLSAIAAVAVIIAAVKVVFFRA